MAGGIKRRRLLARLRRGHFHNVGFLDFCDLIQAHGFQRVRTAGSHRAFAHPRVPYLINLQPEGGEAKPYQIRQFLRLVKEYNLRLEDER